MTIGIIGAGASGMAAAITAAQNPDVKVLLLERQARVGRKLQATGNGRCNLSNTHAVPEHFHGEDPSFTKPALAAFSPEETLSWFQKLGLLTVIEPSGKVYPYSDHANSVVDVLRFALNRDNIELVCGFEVQRIRKFDGGFSVIGSEASYNCDKLIIACGGLAGSKLGGSMSGYKLLRSFGHRVTKLRPSLVQLRSDWSGLIGLKGVRTNCHVTIQHEGLIFAESLGELQFTDYGLSGPVIFEISRDVCQNRGRWSAVLDFIPQWSREQLLDNLIFRTDHPQCAEDLLTGILHNRLGRVLVQSAGIPLQTPLRSISLSQLKGVCDKIKALEVSLIEPMGMDNAQVTAGGIVTEEFDANSMESLLVPNLYACGEVLDIDGDCGGYNLQWAWSSGRMAGMHAARCEP